MLIQIFTVIFFLYPLLVFLAVRYFDVGVASLVLSGILLARFLLRKKIAEPAFSKIFDVILWVVLLNNVLNIYFKSELILKMYPVLMSAAFAGTFIDSLYRKKPIIEKFARLYDKNLTEDKLLYIHSLTVVWSIWLSLNTLLALYTALFTSFDIWMIYNNVVFYLVCGLIFAGDLSYRKISHVHSQ